MAKSVYAKSGIYLGYPLDQLLDRECDVLVTKPDQPHDQGILFTTKDGVGSGNIVIMGPPGSGKSTLGLHIAHACAARKENRCFSAYFSLECTPQETATKAGLFGWEGDCRIVSSLPVTCGGTAATLPSDALYRLLTSDPKCPIRPDGSRDCKVCGSVAHLKKGERALWPKDSSPKVLLMSLAPRPTTSRPDDHTTAFWNRYKQLEGLLAAAFELRTKVDREGAEGKTSNWILPLMVIDSVNMMAEGMPNRDQLLPLFHLFRKYETTGVFLVESSTATPFDSTLADVVIRLTVGEDQGYSGRYFEVVKSRYRNQVNGRHPYKTAPVADDRALRTPPVPRMVYGDAQGDLPRCGMAVLPSVHYAVLRGFFYAPDGTGNKSAWKDTNGNDAPGSYWGARPLSYLLPGRMRSGSTVLVEGPAGTYKTNLAVTFLGKGLTNGEPVLLVRLNDDEVFRERKDGEGAVGPAVSEDLPEPQDREKGFWSDLRPVAEAEAAQWQALASKLKATISVWEYRGRSTPQLSSSFVPRLYEVDLKTGNLLAEEFIQLIREIVIRQHEKHPITRVALDDVSAIGVAYPFLRNSSTSGDLLLPSVVHLMKYGHIDFVVTGTTGIHPLADDAVARVRAVADTVLRCQYMDVFGRKHVVIEGERQIGSVQEEDVATQSVPATIENVGTGDLHRFRVTRESLRGLVGFDNGQVYRPGISLELFQEGGKVHQEYNREVLAMMRAAFASPEGLDGQPADRLALDRSAVTLTPFGSELSAAVHGSLDIFTDNEPLNRTVVCTVDEFVTDGPEGTGGASQHERFVEIDAADVGYSPARAPSKSTGKPRLFDYYNNVLLLAYRIDVPELGGLSRCGNWKAIAGLAESIPLSHSGGLRISERFWVDRTAPETLTCALLDAVLADRHFGKALTIGEAGSVMNPEQLGALGASPTVGDALSTMTPEQRRALGPTATIGEALTRTIESATDRVRALASLWAMSGSWAHDDGPEPLPSDAAIYLCWYSQLRALIARSPQLGSRLRVIRLPGGGFTGDWQVGVRRGSVSAHLGQAVLKKLLSPAEDYRRFVAGVGLPCSQSLAGAAASFLAWPEAPTGMTLAQLSSIHDEARSRNGLLGYKEVRLALYATARQLVPVDGRALSYGAVERTMENLVKRVEALSQA